MTPYTICQSKCILKVITILEAYVSRQQKKLHLYDIYGVDTVNGALCGNTILCKYYSPFFQYGGNNGEYIKSMTQIGGDYVAYFNAFKEYQVEDTLTFNLRFSQKQNYIVRPKTSF